MTTETQSRAADAGEDIAELQRFDTYEEWQRQEGVPSIGGFYIEDLATVELSPWERKGGAGAFINLEGTGGVNDGHLIEIAPGKSSRPERHLYEEMVYVVTGHGSTSVWLDEDRKQTFEWGPGSLFAIPLNASYQHFNGSGSEPARYFSVTNAPTIIRMFHNIDFVLDNPYDFEDRFSGEQGYFDGEGELTRLWDRKFWTSNFVPDAHSLPLHDRPTRGAGGTNVSLEFADNSMGAHISEFPVGTYKKAHRHGPGAHVIILDGVGFSTLWEKLDDDKIRCDWKPGAVIVPPDNWFHQHFNTGNDPARYLALKFTGKKYHQSVGNFGMTEGSGVSITEGGWQIEYPDEDPAVHEMFEREARAHGATCRMQGLIPSCTGVKM